MDRRDDGREPYLCAYVTPRQGRKWDSEDLANRLSRKLPEYMIPSFFVSMVRLPLTANGKLDRKALPAPDRLTQARDAGYAPPRNATEAALCRIWSEALHVENPGIHDSFFALGGDSIIAMQIVARASREGFRLLPKQILQHPTVAELAIAAEPPDSLRPAIGPPTGPSPLTPVQRRFFSQEKADPHYYNQSVLLEVPAGIGEEVLQLAIDAAVERHEALRLRFHQTDGVWMQDAASDKRAELTTYHVTGVEFAALAQELHSSLNFADGPLFRAGLFRFGEGQAARLLLVVHHLAIDAVSWAILIEDIYIAYRDKTEAVNLPPGTAGYRQWADHLESYARSGALASEPDRWLRIGTPENKPLPVDRAPVPNGNLVGEAEEVSLELSDPVTHALLHEGSRAYHTRIDDLLLSALVLAFRDWTGEEALSIELEGHGRDHPAIDLDVTRTVGWFTSIFPVVLRASSSLADTIKAVKEQLRGVPNRGANWGLLKYGSAGDSARQRLEVLPPAEVLVNYIGQTDQALPSGFEWKALTESAGGRSPRQRRDHLLEINALVSGGRLRVHWTFGRGIHDRETIVRLAESFNRHLERIAAHCSAAEVSTLTPSDVPAARISQQGLDALAANVAGDLEDVYELTPAQQGMLFHTIYEPASGAYVNQLTCRIEGVLEEAVFREAWRSAIARHPALRTSYHWQGIDKPMQVVLRSVDLPWHFEDLRGLSADLPNLLDRDRELRFELTRAPLMRLGLFRTGEHEWHFHWTQHHLLLDGWSAALVLNEVVQAYEALVSGGAPRFAPLRPFRDHVLWLQAQDSKRAERFWREELDGFRTPTPLVLGRPEMEGAARPGKIAEEEILLPDVLSARAAAAAQDAGITLSTLAQGAWAVLLSRYSGESDVVFGYAVSGRPPGLAGAEEMAGMFINVLPSRVRLDPIVPAAVWLRGIQTRTAERDEFSWCGLTEIQGWSPVPAGTPLFESLLIFENYPVEESLKRGATSFRIHDVRAKEPNNYAMTLVVSPEGAGLVLKAVYDDGRFDRATVQRLLGHYREILTSMAADPDAPIARTQMLTSEERRILCEWNATDRRAEPEQTAVDSFRSWVAKEPDRVAVRRGTTSLTYRELDDRSDSLAALLAATVAIHAEDRIAILMQRSEQLVESILAVWKCGAAYVPVDPAYPTDRIRLILEKARPSAVIAGELPPELAAAVPSGIPVVSWHGTPAAESGPRRPHRSVPAGLAYIIFTSGSTGVPKGAMVEHRGMFNHISSMVSDLGLGPSSRVAQTASHCFDISLWQLFAGLTSGGETVIYSDGTIADARALARSFDADAISHAQFVPSYLSAFLEEMEVWPEQRLSGLQWMVTIGETLKPSVVKRWFARFPGIRLMNAYGPTEASDSITHFAMEQAPSMASIPIGRPIGNTWIYILDPMSNLCPIGVKGEICVSGIAVGRGYLFDGERTAAVFQPDPFRDGSRMYRTGDIGCYAPDGNILFFGRRDSQVKIRGHRIELGEIETALAALEPVAEAAVVAREEHGLLSLAAYIVGRDNGSGVNAGAIQAALSRRLPSYMVPETIVVLDSLPKTSNGKIDRKALPAAAMPMTASDADAPRTAAESDLVRIWCSVLGRDRVGVNDRFFEIGGHSLRAIQLVSRIRSEMQSEVTIRDVFECASIRELARRIDGAGRPSSAVIPPAPPRPWYPVSHTQKRIWLASRTSEGSVAHNMASALRIAGNLRQEALTRALDALVERHESLRTVFALKQGEIVQMVRGAEQCGFRMRTSDCSDNEEQAAALRQEEALHPFDLQNGPLFRANLARLSPRTHLLLLTLHHIIADAWSARLLMRELATLYSAFAAGQANPLAPLPLQFKDYATWENQQAHSAEMRAHRDYWLGRLSRDMPRLKLATDFPEPERPTFDAGREIVTVPRDVSLVLAETAQRNRTTLYAVVLSGVFVLLHKHTGQEDLVIGSQAACRERGELEGQVGCYLNTVALRQRIVPGQTIDQVVQATSRMLMESLEHQSYPFDLLVEDLKASRGKGRPPLFDVQADHVPSTTFRTGPSIAPEVEIEDVSGDGGLAKYDLSFFTSDEPDTGLRIVLEYNRSLFQQLTIRRMGENLQELLAAFGESPERAIVPDVPARKTLRAGLRL
jgi:amino acid adenylation domain-containing protein/non-ribosomal peptide synthase protein (TIGR01720 family)